MSTTKHYLYVLKSLSPNTVSTPNIYYQTLINTILPLTPNIVSANKLCLYYQTLSPPPNTEHVATKPVAQD